MSQAFNKMIAAMDQAGYLTEDAASYVAVVEVPNRFVFILQMDDGSFMTGAFFKQTTTGSADFAAHPYYDGGDYAEAVAELAKQLTV